MSDVPAVASEAAHAAAWDLAGDMKTHLEACRAAEGGITSKAVRLVMRVAADAALAAAAPHLDAAWRASYERIAGLHLEAEADVKRAAERLAALEAIAADLAAVLEGYGCPSPGHDWDDRCPRCQVFARWRTVKEAGS